MILRNLSYAGSVMLLFCLVSVRSAGQGSGRSYYVNISGDDKNSGTRARPFQTIQKISSLQLHSGDTVFFRAEQHFTGTLTVMAGLSRHQKKPVVITSYGSGRATIDAGDSAGIEISGGSFVTLEHIDLVGSGRKTGNVKDGISIVSSRGIRLKDLDISGFQKSGLLIYSSQNVRADNVFVHDNGAAGITVEGPYQQRESREIQILNCRAENNPGDPTKLDNHSGNGIVVGNCRKVLIDHCTATNNGWDMPRIGNGPVGIWAYEADSVTIQHCLSYRNKTSKGAADGGGFDFDGGVTHSIIQYCFSYENEGSGYCIFQYGGASPWHDNVYRYNISENDGTVSDSQSGLYVWNNPDDDKQFYNCEVYGNVIYNSKVAALTFAETSKNKSFHFYNNIFVGKDSLVKGSDWMGDVKFEGNDWWSLDKGFYIGEVRDIHTWALKTGKELVQGRLVGLNEDPQFKSPGNTSLISARQLPLLSNYKLPKKSSLKRRLKLDQVNWF